jgi:hypothetical protein
MMKKWLIAIFLPLAGIGLLLYGFHALDKYLRHQVQDQPRFQVAFSSIDVDTPPGFTREQFLAEVKKGSGLPDTVSVLDEDLTPRLEGAFAKHPWVASIRSVDFKGSQGIRVELVFRVPVLAIPQTGMTRLVDGRGILLPELAKTDSIPIWRGHATTPIGSVGTLWGDKDIEAVAGVLEMVRPQQDKLHINAVTVRSGEVIFTTKHGYLLLWGHPRGKQPNGEANETDKLAALVKYSQDHGGLEPANGPQEIDLRPKEKPIIRSLLP